MKWKPNTIYQLYYNPIRYSGIPTERPLSYRMLKFKTNFDATTGTITSVFTSEELSRSYKIGQVHPLRRWDFAQFKEVGPIINRKIPWL